MLEQKNPLILAFIGDAVHTLYVRENLANVDAKIGELHKQASKQVCATTQSIKYDKMVNSFCEIEKEIANRARNISHNTMPKNCNPSEYHKATALEAVIGYNYLLGKTERVEELCKC